MTLEIENAKYTIKSTTCFRRQLKKAKKQGKNILRLREIIKLLADGKTLEMKYKDHHLITDNIYQGCRECHIEPDWLLIYKIEKDEIVLLLCATGSHSELFR